MLNKASPFKVAFIVRNTEQDKTLPMRIVNTSYIEIIADTIGYRGHGEKAMES